MIQRMKLFMTITIPAIKVQSDRNFILCLIINKEYEDMLRLAISIPFLSFYSMEEYAEFVKRKRVQFQSRIDSDDFIEPGYMEDVNKTMFRLYNSNPNLKTAAIHYQVLKRDLLTGEVWKREKSYSNKLTSMFLSIWQTENYDSIYTHAHNEWWKHVDHVETRPHGLAQWVMHDEQHHKRPDRGDLSINKKCSG